MSSVEIKIAEELIDGVLKVEGFPGWVYNDLRRSLGLIHTNRMTLEDLQEQMAIIEQLGYQDNG